MKRKDDWPELLECFLRDREQKPFAWGVQDCALLVCDAVQVMTGVDLAEDFREQYSTRLQAARSMRRCGCATLADLADLVAARHGIPEVPVPSARRGDVVLLDMKKEGPALGIIGLSGSHVLAAAYGLVSIPLTSPQCLRAWRIG